jgi:mRNA-degrading endonuclease RelE of RelBE toxin-antitoxin system
VAYKIIYTPDFEKQFKKLSKKFKSLPSDLAELIEELRENPFRGNSLGKNCFKVRLAIKSKGKGKSGGARVISL